MFVDICVYWIKIIPLYNICRNVAKISVMENLKAQGFGPIKHVDVTFGDLTLLVGPQASGKSLFLELFKLVKDRQHVVDVLKKYSYILSAKDASPILGNYFGEGLENLITEGTFIETNGTSFSQKTLLKALKSASVTRETVFYIPAQRILAISDGRPKNFMEFDNTTPYVLRNFSEILRVFVQGGLGNPDTIFPMRNRLKGSVRSFIDKTIFHGAKVVIDQNAGQRKMKLDIGETRLPFMAWSAGQKEFMPLLLAMYCLSGPPTSVINKEDYKWVIIEEPEMGLHPRAIETVILQIIELLQSGYKVIVSTHSTTLLEFAWVFESLKKISSEDFKSALCDLFEVSPESTVASLFDSLAEKEIKSFFFSNLQQGGVVSTDITSLDVGSREQMVAEWGGLSSFATRASDVVSSYYQSE